jgi:hypothetical protein
MGKITDEELSRVNKIKQESIELASILGELAFNKILLEEQIEKQKERVIEVKKEESVLFEDLKIKYGNVMINIETGEFN